MATSQDLKINYLIEAIDNATSTIKKIDETIKGLNSSYSKLENQVEQVNNIQVQNDKTLKKLEQDYSSATEEVNKFNSSTKYLNSTMLESIQHYDSLFNKIFRFFGLGELNFVLKAIIASLAILTAGFAALTSSKTVIDFLVKAFGKLDDILLTLSKSLDKFLSGFPILNKVSQVAIDALRTTLKSLIDRIVSIHEQFSRTIEVLKTLGKIFFDVGIKTGAVESLFVKMAASSGILTIAVNALFQSFKKMNGSIDEVDKNTNELNNTVTKAEGGFRGLFERVADFLHLKEIGNILKSIVIDAGLLGASFIALASSEKAISFLKDAIFRLDYLTIKWGINLDLILEKFPLLAKASSNSFTFIRGVILSLEPPLVNTHNLIKTTTETVKSIGKSFLEASLRTELFERGLLAISTKAGLVGSVLSGLGFILLNTDSILGKITGGALIALSVALIGLSAVITQVLGLFGSLVYQIGTKLVEATVKSIDKFEKLNKTTFAFQFIVENLNKETKNATGSFEEWNSVVESFTDKYGFATSEIQNSISELLRLGNSIGLSKTQMKSMIPIVADLAVANHKDLFTSTLAVTEALAGQTVMLQNMGVNLTQHALAETKAAKAIKGKITTMSEHDKVQLRYNALIEKTVATNGLAEQSLNTISGILRRTEAAWENINAQMGIGASIIENRVYGVSFALLKLFEQFSPVLLNITGFLSALLGRFLQGIGILTQYAFTIVLLTSAIAGLNVLLKNQIIAKWILQLAEAEIITVKLAGANQFLADTFQVALRNIGNYGLGIQSAGALVVNTFKSIGLAAYTAIAPFLLIAAKIALIVGSVAAVIYVLYEAFKRLEEQTGFLTRAWQNLLRWWNEFGIIDDIKKSINSFIVLLQRELINVIFAVAQGFISLYKIVLNGIDVFIKARAGAANIAAAFLQFVQPAISTTIAFFDVLYRKITNSRAFIFVADVLQSIKKGFDDLGTKIAEFADKADFYFNKFASAVGNLLSKLPAKFAENIGFSNAYAESYIEVSNGINSAIQSTLQLSEADKKAADAINKKIENADNLIAKLEQQRLKEIELLTASNKIDEEETKNHEKKISRINYEIEAINKLKKSLAETVLGQFSVGSVQSALSQTSSAIQDIIKELKDPKKSDEDRAKLVKQLRELYTKLPALNVISSVSGAVGMVGAFANGAASAIKASATAIGTAIAGPLGPIIGDMVGQIIDVFGIDPAEFQKKIIDTFRDIPKILTNVFKNLAQFFSGPMVRQAIEAFIQELPALIESITYLFAVYLGSPTFWADVAFAATKAFIRSIPLMIKGFSHGLANAVKDIVRPIKKVFDFLKNNFKYLAIAFAIPLLPIIAAFFAIKYIIENYKRIIEKLQALFTELPKKMLEFFNFIVTGLPIAIMQAYQKALIFLQEGILKLFDLWKRLMDFIYVELPKIIFSAILQGLSQLVEWIKQLPTVLQNAVKQMINQILEGIKQIPSIMTNAVKSFYSSITDAGKTFVKSVVSGAKDFIKELIKSISGTGGALGSIGGGILGSIPAGNLVGGAIGAIGGGGFGFEQGGVPYLRMLRAQAGLLVGGNSLTGDRIPVRVNSREMILTTNMQEKLFKMLSSGDMGSDRPIEITTNVQLDERTIGKAFSRLESNGWRR